MTNTSTDIASLADRLEAASGADREIDLAIALLVGTKARNGSINISHRYTASLDAALSLVPDGRLIGIETYDDNGIYPEHVRASAWVQGAKRQFAATPALALCAAAVRSILRGVPG